MAQIDLARATVRLKDGYSKTGAVNNVAGASVGDTSVAVDGFVAAIPTGVQLRFASHDTVYVVENTTGGATPTDITFTPALEQVVADNEVVTVGPNFIEVVMGEGNLTYDQKKAYDYVRNKRKISFVKTGDEEPTDVSIDAIWEYLSSAASEPPTMEEALNKEGAAASWVTSGADPCEPYCVDIEVDYVPPCSSASNYRERVTLKEFRWESLNHSLKEGTISTKGNCKITAPAKERY